MARLSHLKGDSEGIYVDWEDGVRFRLPWKYLRDRCPCAVCAQAQVKHQKSAPVVDLLPVLTLKETVPIRGLRMHPVGNYAYTIEFSDGHHSGIYLIEFLRALGLDYTREP